MSITGRSSPKQHRLALLFKLRPQIIVLVLLGVAAMVLVSPGESSAIPAWARKYNADCGMCHYAAYPRLNSFGLEYRRMGYRTPVEVGKDQDVTNVSNFLAGRLRTQFAYQNQKGTTEKSEIRFPEAALIYAGAFSRNFSGYLHALAENGSNVDVHGHIMGMWGSMEKYLMVEIGQSHMFLQRGIGGFDRPVGITITPIYSTQLTSSTSPMVFQFDLRQKFVEASYVYGPGRLFVAVANGLNQNGSGTQATGDIDKQKDVLVGYDHILDRIASGFTLFYYNGTTHATVTPTSPTQPASFSNFAGVSNAFAFSRFGFNVNKIFTFPGIGFFEIMGGYIRSQDHVPIQLGPDIKGNSYYVETQQYIPGPELTFFERYSVIDLNESRPNSTRKDYTVGVVTPIETFLRLAGEYTYTDNRLSGVTANVALLEVQAIW